MSVIDHKSTLKHIDGHRWTEKVDRAGPLALSGFLFNPLSVEENRHSPLYNESKHPGMY